MGMDVYGKKQGYFRANVWSWHPLWDYCLEQHGEIAGKVKHGHSNSGDGLNSLDSVALATALKTALDSGSADEYIQNRNKRLSELPRLACDTCSGTGIRTDRVGQDAGMPERELSLEMASLTGRTHGWCNGCGGEGKRDDHEIHYILTREKISEFAEFLYVCGGFSIR